MSVMRRVPKKQKFGAQKQGSETGTQPRIDIRPCGGKMPVCDRNVSCAVRGGMHSDDPRNAELRCPKNDQSTSQGRECLHAGGGSGRSRWGFFRRLRQHSRILGERSSSLREAFRRPDQALRHRRTGRPAHPAIYDCGTDHRLRGVRPNMLRDRRAETRAARLGGRTEGCCQRSLSEILDLHSAARSFAQAACHVYRDATLALKDEAQVRLGTISGSSELSLTEIWMLFHPSGERVLFHDATLPLEKFFCQPKTLLLGNGIKTAGAVALTHEPASQKTC